MNRMMTIVLGILVAVSMGILIGPSVFRNGALTIVRSVHAQGGGLPGQKACSLAILNGEYLFTGRGEAPEYQHGPGLPMVFAGVRTFDGQGRLSQVETISLGGKIRRSREDGVYSMNADCTGTMTVVGVRTFDMFVSRDGSEGVAIRTTDGSIGTQTFKKR